jgi:hypothetical protein
MAADSTPPPPAPDADAQAWLDRLAAGLPRHAEVLHRLVVRARQDPRVVQVSVGCSVGRDAGDELSDLDCELSLEADAWPSGLELVEPLVRSAGDAVEILHHQWSGAAAGPNRRTAVIYAGGVQLDLMVWPVTAWSGMHPPDTVVLHATRQVFDRPWDPSRARPTLERVREWHFLGWWALLDADKYLRRSSPWEARQRLEEARHAACQLFATAQRLPFPEYGITTLLDAPEPRLPAGIEPTVAGIDPDQLRTAVERCAELLDAQLAPAVEAVTSTAETTPSPLAGWARQRLGMSPPSSATSRG